MGLAPLLMGMYLLYKRLRRNLPEETAEQDAQGALQSGSSWISTFLLMFSNSGDSLAIFFPLLAESDRDSLLWEVTLFLGMALFWLLMAWRLAEQPQVAIRIEHIGEKLVPWIMMAAGIYILVNTGTDTMA